MTVGASPYERDTYRYSPMLAAALMPNVLLHPLWGKCFFAAGDLLAGWLIGDILEQQGYETKIRTVAMRIWLFNPFTVTVSTRGSCESLVSILMLAALHGLTRGRVTVPAALYGLATHLRIYPIIYALPMVLFLGETAAANRENTDGKKKRNKTKGAISRLVAKLVTRETVLFALVSALVFFASCAVCFVFYGEEFQHEAFLYHVRRSDIRHNFSPSWYGVYLMQYGGEALPTGETKNIFAKVVGVAPQLLVVTVIGIKYARDLPLCLFLQTLGFVTFNTVCTAQYFVWYFCLLPLAFPEWARFAEWKNLKDTKKTKNKTKTRKVLFTSWFPHLKSLITWLLAQVLWLGFAYLLEFCGKAVFFELWIASVTFLGANAWLLVDVIKRRRVSAEAVADQII